MDNIRVAAAGAVRAFLTREEYDIYIRFGVDPRETPCDDNEADAYISVLEKIAAKSESVAMLAAVLSEESRRLLRCYGEEVFNG